VISELPGTTRGIAWGPNGTVLLAGEYSDRDGLFEVSERGGELRERFILEAGEDHFHNLAVLPGDRGVLITVHRGTAKIVYLLADDTLTPLVTVESNYLPTPVYAMSGHVLYFRGATNNGIWALPFSAETLEVGGEPFLVAASATSPSVSRDGTLIYQMTEFEPERRLVWVDRQGEVLGSIGQPKRGFDFPTLSPDGEKLVVAAGYEADMDIWIFDVARGTQTRLTRTEAMDHNPLWTPDGKRVIYRHRPRSGPATILIRNADGSGEPETLVEGGTVSLSPDGKLLVFSRSDEQTGDDLWLMELGTDTEPVPLVRDASDQLHARISPDLDAIAYTSDESGRDEVYIKRFPSGEGKWQASLDGGRIPRWSPKGGELFWENDGDLMVAEVRVGPEVTFGTPRRLFTWDPSNYLRLGEYDIAADAERLVMIASKDDSESSDPADNMLMLVENWSAE